MHHVRYLDAKIEIDVMEEKNHIFQTQQNVVLEDEVTKLRLQKLMDQRRIWKGYNRNALCWVFFCVNDKKEVDNKNHELMICFLIRSC